VRVVGVLPAAGRAERLQPLDGSKELLEVGGRPVLDYAVERLRAADPEEIRIVVRPEKEDVVERAQALELAVVEARPESLAESVFAGIAGLADDDAVLIDLPDSIWEPVDGFRLLLAALTPGRDVVLGTFRSPEPERGDVVAADADDRVTAVHVKSPEPPGAEVWGAVVARVGALGGLARHEQPGRLFDELAREGRVHAVRFPGEFLDIGTKEALARARST
jgi:glucose-1-phosphate thymidylyltransferase